MHFSFDLAVNGLRDLFSAKYSERVGSIGDGKCDGILNVPAYKYDLGDCCKPLKDAICDFEDDCFCHMFTHFHGRILNFNKNDVEPFHDRESLNKVLRKVLIVVRLCK